VLGQLSSINSAQLIQTLLAAVQACHLQARKWILREIFNTVRVVTSFGQRVQSTLIVV
jgi:hypothetical protein